MNKATQKASQPDFPWLEEGDVDGVSRFLHERNWLEEGETVVSCDRAGEGNMNLTLRVDTGRRSVILKQSRPWVEKYDEISAPWDRVVFEHRFYQRVKPIADVAERMPRVLAFDASARALLLEDLRDARDLFDVYRGGKLRSEELGELARYARALHEATRGGAEPGFENWDMRALNHRHMYVVPLEEENGVELELYEPGLTEAAAELSRDRWFVQQMHEVGERYLAIGRCLVHGDLFPGSWLRTSKGLRVIDPEFSFYGDPEFDLGVTVAHLALAGQGRSLAERFLTCYAEQGGHIEINESWLARYAAAEVVRRLLGVAQLPIPLGHGQRLPLLNRARQTMKDRMWETLWPAD